MVRARPLVRTTILGSAVIALFMVGVGPAQAHPDNIYHYHGNDMAYWNESPSWIYACPGGVCSEYQQRLVDRALSRC